MTPDADRCLVCHHDHTCNGFLCVRCLQRRARTIHWRWHDLNYLTAMQAECNAPITTASAARYALRQAQGRI